eukprot:TRINITY_DN116_c0_g1_i1.p2 TRINITY_DN116_c0_g1~~TRINITY_DN116_c0_g1_i1.p2  ORF type:complete len:170 (+),score=43.28 TRINITY_DN116_c0_g1_i1:490-999(+)
MWLRKFQELNKHAAKREREVAIPQSAPSPSNDRSMYSQNNSYNETDEGESLLHPAQQDLLEVEQEREFNEALIQEREDGIREIEAAMNEVNEIFRDLGTLVLDQGQMIDNIESHIDTAVEKTGAGVAELRQAEKTQRSARTKMCCIALIVIIVGVVAIVALVVGVKFAV